ncbi:MAG: hypothetical protein RLZZ453_584 [Chlamydiota bacterium]|jgi:hypothetical protein
MQRTIWIGVFFCTLWAHTIADTKKNSKPRTLVVILGQLRADALCYQNVKENLIDVLDADLAVCTGTSSANYENSLFYQAAKYRFVHVDPVGDFSPTLDEVCHLIAEEHQLPPTSWRHFLPFGNHILGGVQGCIGSGAIVLFRKWFLLKNLISQNLLEEYDFFVITRSDLIYLLSHPTIDCFDPEHIYLPSGEHYGGLPDRHAVVPKKFILSFLDILGQMILQEQKYYEAIRLKNNINPESLLLVHCRFQHLLEKICYFPYMMYLVRGANDVTNFSTGVFSNEHGYFIKIPSEYEQALLTKKRFETSGYTLSQFYKSCMFSKQETCKDFW